MDACFLDVTFEHMANNWYNYIRIQEVVDHRGVDGG